MEVVDFIMEMMRQDYTSVGFIPAPTVLNWYIKQGFYSIQNDRAGHKVGYLLHSTPKPGKLVKIHQALIDIDHRNLLFGTQMVDKFNDLAQSLNCRGILLRCADDLESNLFWQNYGFSIVKTEFPQNTRHRAINTYMFDLWPRLPGL